VKAAGTDLLDEWEEQQRINHNRLPRSTVHGEARRQSSEASPIDLDSPLGKRPKRRTAVQILDSSSQTEPVVTLPIHQATKPTGKSSAILFPLTPEVQETQQDSGVGPVELRVPPVRFDRDNCETLRSSPISLDDSALGLASPIEDCLTTQTSQLSKPSIVGGDKSCCRDSPSEKYSSKTISQSSRPRHQTQRTKLFITSTADTNHTPGSEIQPASPAGTEASSDLFFPSPNRGNTPQASLSPPANQQPSSLLQPASVNIRSSSGPSSSQAEDKYSSAQQTSETINDSQTSTSSLTSTRLASNPSQDSSSWCSQEQISSKGTNPTEHLAKPLLSRSLPLKRRHSASSKTSDIRARSWVESTAKTQSNMATVTAENSSPTVRSTTPVTDRKLDSSMGFGERVRQARNTRSEAKSPSAPPIRQATPIVWGNNNNLSGYPREIARQINHAPESPLRKELEPDAVKGGREEPALVSGISRQASIYDTAIGSGAMPVHHSVEEEPIDLETSNSTSESGKMQIQQSIESEQPVPRMDEVVMPTLTILGPGEYAIPLPADGRVQSLYNGMIRSKKKALLKYIRKRNSSGVRSAKKVCSQVKTGF
jgi:hypothetical protein